MRPKIRSGAGTLAWCLALILWPAAGLWSDDQAPAAAPDKASAAAATTPPPTPAPSFWDQATLTGDWGGWRTRLGNDGFSPFASWTGEIWGNTRGGVQTGMTQDMLLSWGFDADLQKLVGWSNTTAHMGFNWVQGQRSDKNTGAFNDPSSLDASNQVRVYNFYLQKTVWTGQLVLRAGAFGADQDFFQSPNAGLFLNAGFSAPPTLYAQTLANGDTPVPQYSATAPGGFVKYTPGNSTVYVIAGVYLSDPGPDVSNNHGFDWRISNSAVIIGEMGWNYKLAGRAGTLKGGASYNAGQFRNWSTGASQRGVYGAYFMDDQTLIQQADPSGGDPTPILTAFVFGGWSGPQGLTIPAWTGSVGLNWHAPIPSRTNDVAGVAVLYTGFSSSYTSSAFNLLGAGVPTASETVLEGTYQAQLTPWFSLQPDVQLIFNPANAVTRQTAVVVGARAVVTF